MSIKVIYKGKTIVTETPPPWVWKVCSRTVSVPEFIKQRAKGRMKLESGQLFEHVQITWEEYHKDLTREIEKRMVTGSEMKKLLFLGDIYSKDKP